MEIGTRAQGVKTTLLISKEHLLEAGKDIEEVDLTHQQRSLRNLRDTLLPRIVIESFPL